MIPWTLNGSIGLLCTLQIRRLSRAAGMRLEYALRRCRELDQLVGGTDRPPDQLTAAIRATPARQAIVSAIDAERALERAAARWAVHPDASGPQPVHIGRAGTGAHGKARSA